MLSVALAAMLIILTLVRFHAGPDTYVWVWIASGVVCSIATGCASGLLGWVLKPKGKSGIRGPQGRL